MSYRHGSYRKLSRALRKAAEAPYGASSASLTRSQMDRVLHWSRQAPAAKPAGWGVPRRKRAA